MSAPTPATRAVVYERDNHRCVSCGSYRVLQFQHRQAVGMGGSKHRPGFVEGLTSCDRCNNEYEHRLQSAALRFGWKVARWVEHPGRVPVWFPFERAWFRLTKLGTRVRVSREEAMLMMTEVYGQQYDEEKGLVA